MIYNLTPFQKTIIRRMIKGDYVYCADCHFYIDGPNGATRDINEKQAMDLVIDKIIVLDETTEYRYKLTPLGESINLSVPSRSKKIIADFWNNPTTEQDK